MTEAPFTDADVDAAVEALQLALATTDCEPLVPDDDGVDAAIQCMLPGLVVALFQMATQGHVDHDCTQNPGNLLAFIAEQARAASFAALSMHDAGLLE